MRANYPFLSKEFNNIILQGYEYLVHLLGFQEDGYEHYSGLYEYISDSGNYLMTSPSGIPTINNSKIIDILKYDYIYRKNFGEIKYKENK